MLNAQENEPLTEFLRCPEEHVIQMKSTGKPMVLTICGRPELVVVDLDTYQAMLNKLESFEAALVPG